MKKASPNGCHALSVDRAGTCDPVHEQIGGPAKRARCAQMCEQMLDRMPESFPPNRMMADLQSLKEQIARILDVLEGQADS